jgi:hypothetical protein
MAAKSRTWMPRALMAGLRSARGRPDRPQPLASDRARAFDPALAQHDADLLLERDGPGAWLVETTTVLRGDRDKSWKAYEEELVAAIQAIDRRHNVIATQLSTITSTRT